MSSVDLAVSQQYADIMLCSLSSMLRPLANNEEKVNEHETAYATVSKFCHPCPVISRSLASSVADNDHGEHNRQLHVIVSATLDVDRTLKGLWDLELIGQEWDG